MASAGRAASSRTAARRRLAHLPAKKRDAVRAKERFFVRVADEVARTGNPRIVMDRCRTFSVRMQGRPGFSCLRLYNQFYEWNRKGKTAGALAKAMTARTAAEVVQYLPHMVTLCVMNAGMPFTCGFAELKEHGAPITASCNSYRRRLRELGYDGLIAEARSLARHRARLEREHASAQQNLADKEARLLARIVFPEPAQEKR